jgi:hypothetical protein
MLLDVSLADRSVSFIPERRQPLGVLVEALLRIAENANSAVQQSNDEQQETKTYSHDLSSKVFVSVCYEKPSGKRRFGNSRRHARGTCRPCNGVV